MFVAPDGNIQEVMCCDYGFRSGFGRLYQGGDGEIPKSAFALVRSSLAAKGHTFNGLVTAIVMALSQLCRSFEGIRAWLAAHTLPASR